MKQGDRIYLVIRGLVRRSDREDVISKQVRMTTDLKTKPSVIGVAKTELAWGSP
jgi:hypothetical protein